MFSLYAVLINSSAVQPPKLGNGVRPRSLVGGGGGGWGGCGDLPQTLCPWQFLLSRSLLSAVSFFVFKFVGKGLLICQAYRSLINWFCENLHGIFREGQNCCVFCSQFSSVWLCGCVFGPSKFACEICVVTLWTISLSHTNTHDCLCRCLSRFSIVLYLQLGCCFGSRS